MDERRLILGLREVPRPVGEGYIYYKFFPKQADKVLLYLNLYKTDDTELEGLFRQSLLEISRKERLSTADVMGFLSSYTTENMQQWTQEVLARAVSGFVKNAETHTVPSASASTGVSS